MQMLKVTYLDGLLKTLHSATARKEGRSVSVPSFAILQRPETPKKCSACKTSSISTGGVLEYKISCILFYLLQDNLCSLSAEILLVHVAVVAFGKRLGDADPSKCFKV